MEYLGGGKEGLRTVGVSVVVVTISPATRVSADAVCKASGTSSIGTHMDSAGLVMADSAIFNCGSIRWVTIGSQTISAFVTTTVELLVDAAAMDIAIVSASPIVLSTMSAVLLAEHWVDAANANGDSTCVEVQSTWATIVAVRPCGGACV